MDDLTVTLQILSIAAFLLLVVIGLARVRRGIEADRWLTAAFTVLAVVLLGSLVAPADEPAWVEKGRVLILVALPWLLIRFASTFQPLTGRSRAAVHVAFAAVLCLTLAVPGLPEEGDSRPVWFQAYLVLALGYWTALSAAVVIRLWRAGRGHPTVSRRRMRLMSLGAAGLNAGIVLAGSNLHDSEIVDAVLYLVVFLSAVAFVLGFSPPRMVRLVWRDHEQEAVRGSIGELMRAETPNDVADVLLPQVTAIVGAGGAVLTDAGGAVVASHGVAPDVARELAAAPAEDGARRRFERVPIRGEHGSLVVLTSPYTPFFGPDDLDMMRALASLGGLGIERAELLERARSAATAAEESREAADRANRAKNDFLSSMSHELRTPLNAILGFGQLLQLSGDIDGDDREGADQIVRAGQHLLELVNEVLDLARVESGRLPLSPEAVRLDELVREAVGLMRPAAAERSIAMTTDLDAAGIHVHADRQRLKQVLLNLISNGLKYNRDAGELEITCVPAGPQRVRVNVRDTGPGIAPERMDSLFKPFERLGAENSGIEGTGLGLALSHRLIELMGGTIGVDTAVGEGSTFWLEFAVTGCPVAQLDHDHEEDAEAVAQTGLRRTLLLIEDNLSNVKLVEAILKARPGVEIIPAMQGTLGLELAARHQPDLILLDLHLPDVTGKEVLHRLRADPATRDIPVVILSADATPGQVKRMRAEGAADYITKPLQVAHFLGVVDELLGTT